jgi:L-ascorbate metabolism protein UlaG (beta-lactamase superfamily)
MDITWLGNAATRVRTRTAAVVMDPYDRSAGGTMGRPDAHIVTISHDDPLRNGIGGVAPADGSPIVLRGPGEYEIRGVQVESVSGALKESLDVSGVRSVIWHFAAEDLRWAHLGGLGTQPTKEQMDLLADVDIVIIPIALSDTLDPKEAARAVRHIEPSIVIPIGYDPSEPEALTAFLAAVGGKQEPAVSRFTISRRGGESTEMRVVLLEARA